MAHHELTGHGGHAGPDAEYRETPAGAQHEYTDATVGPVVKFGFWLAVIAIVVHVGLYVSFDLLRRVREQPVESQPFPTAIGQEQRLPAGARLQRYPPGEMFQFRTNEEAILQRYGWVDRERGLVHIPIADAMRLTVERGLPVRPAAAAETGPTPGMMPADSSAGRTLERRRQ